LPHDGLMFTSWNAAFEYIADRSKEQQFVLAFDEFPYACAANKSLRSILQNVIDHHLKETRLFLILCGSQVSFMEKEVLGYKSPLFGRRTMQIQLGGFDYLDASKMLSGFIHEDIIKFYSCIGGTPYYLAQIDPDLSFEDNIKQLYFRNSGYLYYEPLMLLQQELREPAMYNSIISAIAAGASRLNDIVMRVGEEKTKVVKYIRTLIDLRILEREYPFDDNPETSRKSIYRITDACYYFWYRFVFPYRSKIENGLGALIADQEVLTTQILSSFIGKPAFEDICQQYLKRLNMMQKLPFLATRFGRWWGNDPIAKTEADLDVVLGSRRSGQLLIGECKWTNEKVSDYDIKTWMNKKHLLSVYPDRYYYYFSKSGYSDSAIQLCIKENLTFVTLAMLFAL
jgi:AAA+ ATPase superfamily predicted ATPase